MKTTVRIITGKKLFIYQVVFNDGTITQYASIYDSPEKHPGVCDKKVTTPVELISMGFNNQKDILNYYPGHHIFSLNDGVRITRELRSTT